MKRYAPAVARNSAAIAAVLAKELPASGTVLEIASGSGEHAVFMARRFPNLIWQPSDADPEALRSIAAWHAEERADNIAAPITLDASARDWPLVSAFAILCVNMVHISPWAAAEGLFAGAGRTLPEGAPLILYGPFLEPDAITAPSNLDFDISLRSRNQQWGIRGIDAIDELAGKNGLSRKSRYEMPANNLALVYRRY